MSKTNSGDGQIERIAVSVDEAAKMLGISRWSAYQLCDQGKIISRYEGRRRLVSVASLHAYFDGLPTERVEESA